MKTSARYLNALNPAATWHHWSEECTSRRRAMIRKRDPIGIPNFRGQGAQRAVTMVLEAVYEQSFLDCSYSFRPGRSAHQALRIVQSETVKMAGKWILEVGIRNFFGTLDHSLLRDIVRKWVRDGVLSLRRPVGR